MKTELEILPRLLRPARTSPLPDCFSAPASATPQGKRKPSIATHDWREMKAQSSRFTAFLTWLRQVLDRLLCLLNVAQREFAGFNKMRHDRLRSSTEYGQQIVDEPSMNGAARHYRFENMRAADFSHPAHGLLFLKAIHHRLNRCICWPVL